MDILFTFLQKLHDQEVSFLIRLSLFGTVRALVRGTLAHQGASRSGVGFRVLVFAWVTCLFAQGDVPRFRAENVRPHGSAEPHPLVPGLLTWIFGSGLGSPHGCSAANLMDPATYKTELCGTRVVVGGIDARLIAVMPGQINLRLPDHAWENENVDVQVIRNGLASAKVPVYFGFKRPVLSIVEPAFAGMPVWIRIVKPWGTGWLRYPFHTEPWDTGPASLEVRFGGKEVPVLSVLPYASPPDTGMMMGLPGEAPSRYLHRIPLHLVYPLDRPGIYEVRYTEYRYARGQADRVVWQQSDWTRIEIQASTEARRRAWLQSLVASPPVDTIEVLCNFLPSLLAQRDEAALRVLARYLDSKDPVVRQYAEYALNYFDSGLLRRVVPGRKPLRGGVR